jgi:hypothetical protein
MGNPKCEWVRARLPLWVESSEDPSEQNDEGSDLSTEERRSVSQHLRGCASCREHESALKQALEALAAAAAVPRVPRDYPSLWPELERRIANHQNRNPNRLRQPLPLRWGLVAASRRRPRWVVGLSLAAAVVTLMIGFPVLRRHRADAEFTIRANAEPIADYTAPVVRAEVELPPAEDSVREVPASDLVQVEPLTAPEGPTPRVDAAPALKAPAALRFGYDLEHGIPMPPDARDAKPVY